MRAINWRRCLLAFLLGFLVALVTTPYWSSSVSITPDDRTPSDRSDYSAAAAPGVAAEQLPASRQVVQPARRE